MIMRYYGLWLALLLVLVGVVAPLETRDRVILWMVAGAALLAYGLSVVVPELYETIVADFQVARERARILGDRDR